MAKKLVLLISAVLFAVSSLFAQNKQVTGTVTSTDGKPVAGATVVVEGTNIGTSTDSNGKYTISAPANGVLTFSFIGYADASVVLNGKTTINAILKESSESIDDVIVVAFGEAKKEAFTGSAAVVSADDLTKTQSSNVTDALVGKVAGMQMTSSSGRPGSGQNIRIRGFGSLNASNAPLWVVDGVPFEGDINTINPADIENISVLKDAASNALYGARGANGVIMVTTKRAKAGDASVTFEGKWGVNQRALPSYDVASGAGEYYELHYAALNNYAMSTEAGQAMSPEALNAYLNGWMLSNDPGGLGTYQVLSVPEGEQLIGLNGKVNPNAKEGNRVVGNDGKEYWLQPDDWMDALYKNSFRQEYSASVSAAGSRSNFYASFGYLDNEGIADGSSYERYTLRLRSDYQAKKWLKVGGNFSFTNYKSTNGSNVTSADNGGEGSGNSTGNAYKAGYTPSIYPIYIRDGKGNILYDQWGMPRYDSRNGENGGYSSAVTAETSNDLQDLQLDKFITEGNAMSANAFADFKIYRDLKFTVNGGINVDGWRSSSVYNPYYGQFAQSYGGGVTKGHSRQVAYNCQQLLNYTHTFGTEHNLDVLLGHEMYNVTSTGLSASKKTMFSPDNYELGGCVVDGGTASSSKSEYNNEGYFARAQYNWAEKLFVAGSYRRDASSRFHPDHRWGNFWSASAAWLINKEAWFNAPWVDLLKVKASYGSQGNDGIGDYLYVDMYSIENNGEGGIATVWARKGNPNITWETNGNLNTGVEFSFWRGRLAGSVDYFYRKTSDMLMSLPVAPSLGYTSYYTNVGDMLNQGVEIELNADLIRRKNFTWTFGLNMTHFQNELVYLPDQYKNNATHDGKLQGRQLVDRFLAEGQSIYTFYMPTYAGPDKETGVSTWYYYDEDEKGNKVRKTTTDYTVANDAGCELQGKATPDLYGGFNTTLSFYGVDISANFTYQIGGQALDYSYQDFMGSPYKSIAGGAMHRDLQNAWTPENKNTDVPRLFYGDQYTNATSSRFLTDASYLNIQNITVGYTLPQNITRKFLVEKLRVFVACDNVALFSQRKGFDPRQSFSGMTDGMGAYYYAPIRTISGGVSVTF